MRMELTLKSPTKKLLVIAMIAIPCIRSQIAISDDQKSALISLINIVVDYTIQQVRIVCNKPVNLTDMNITTESLKSEIYFTNGKLKGLNTLERSLDRPVLKLIELNTIDVDYKLTFRQLEVTYDCLTKIKENATETNGSLETIITGATSSLTLVANLTSKNVNVTKFTILSVENIDFKFRKHTDSGFDRVIEDTFKSSILQQIQKNFLSILIQLAANYSRKDNSIAENEEIKADAKWLRSFDKRISKLSHFY